MIPVRTEPTPGAQELAIKNPEVVWAEYKVYVGRFFFKAGPRLRPGTWNKESLLRLLYLLIIILIS
jgi:hypothetical protein